MAVSPRQGEERTWIEDIKNLESLIPSRFCGGRNRTRTCDPIDVNDVLSARVTFVQSSHVPS